MHVPALPRGFRVAGVHCGIKQDPSREDLSLFASDREAVAAGVYTQNRVQAAAVVVNRARTPTRSARGVVVNSGNANACTGDRGLDDAREMCRLAAQHLGAQPDQVLVMSTGVIGSFLPMEGIRAGVAAAARQLARDDAALLAAARGITTTDRGPKIAGRAIRIGDQSIQITGVCKGAAMIGPRMATMLCVLMTDAGLAPDDAQRLLAEAVDDSFNCISVEGHMSTNDTVLLLASGASGSAPLAAPELDPFRLALGEVCVELAKMIPDDGEGSTHLVRIELRGCRSRDEARRIAKTVAESALVKTAIAGADPNWGRIVSAAGYAGVPFDPRQLRLCVNGHLLFQRGAPVPFDPQVVSGAIRGSRETVIELVLAEGESGIRFWTSDLTVDYVRANSEYTT